MPDPSSPRPQPLAGRRSRLPYVLLGVFALVVLVGTAAWFLFLKGSSQPPLTISDCKRAGTGKVVPPAALAGGWKVVPGTDGCATTAGYRVKEDFAAVGRETTANGRTSQVTGGFTVAGTQVTTASFVVDMTTLHSDQSRRDDVIHTRALETDRFPQAKFTLTSPVSIPTITEGVAFDVAARGTLTLHGVTKAVTITLHAKLTGNTVTVQGSAPVHMADYGISPPTIGGFVSVADNGSFEFLVSLQK